MHIYIYIYILIVENFLNVLSTGEWLLFIKTKVWALKMLKHFLSTSLQFLLMLSIQQYKSVKMTLASIYQTIKRSFLNSIKANKYSVLFSIKKWFNAKYPVHDDA